MSSDSAAPRRFRRPSRALPVTRGRAAAPPPDADPGPERPTAPDPDPGAKGRAPPEPDTGERLRDRLATLRETVRDGAENRPGIYRIVGPDDELLYVGKSVRVRTRLLSYFRASPGEKAGQIVRHARRVEWEYVPDEFGALLAEMRQIHRGRPRFNVVHKRKRAYAFVKLTAERAPRLVPVRTVRPDGATYFGPFPAVGRTARTVRELAHVLGLRGCPGSTPIHWSDQLDFFGSPGPARCLRADTGTCLAPCCGRTSEAAYRARVDAARSFLEGRGAVPIRLVREAMREAAARLDFEYAALQRDRIERLQRFREEITAFRGRVEGLSFVYGVPGWNGAERLYLVRRGRVRGSFPRPSSSRALARAARRIDEVWSEPGGGPAGLTPEDAGEILMVARWFRLRPEERERTARPEEWLERARTT